MDLESSQKINSLSKGNTNSCFDKAKSTWPFLCIELQALVIHSDAQKTFFSAFSLLAFHLFLL